MGFGIEIFGKDGGGEFLVTDTDQNLINYQVTGSGIADSLSSATVSAGGRVFINGNTTAAQGHVIAAQLGSGYSVEFKKVTFDGSPAINNNLTNVSGTNVSVNYIILTKMTDIANIGTNFGIQLFTSGGDVAFDSRRCRTNDTFDLIDAKGPRSQYINTEITTNGDAYLEISSLYSLITSNAESSVAGCTWNGSGTAPGRLRFLSFFTIPEMNSTDYFRNHNTLLLGKLR